jgi:hypothetical protein
LWVFTVSTRNESGGEVDEAVTTGVRGGLHL